MITPFFKLYQDDSFLIVEIRAPNANIRDTEIEFFDRSFYFSSVPYFLRLALTGDVEGGTADAKTDYNVDTGRCFEILLEIVWSFECFKLYFSNLIITKHV